jgi:tetratricopeptide (TPR) repeat protein
MAILKYVSMDSRGLRRGSIGSMSLVSVSAKRSSRRRRIALLALSVVALVAVGAWLRGNVAAAWNARSARNALSAGRLIDATRAVERWLMFAPFSGEAHYYKASIAWARNDFSTTGAELARARSLGYSWLPLNRLRGLLLARTNETTEAETLLRQVIDNAGKPDPEVAEALVRIYLGTFRLIEAQEVLDRWARAAPHDARPHLLQTEVDIRINTDPEIVIARYRAALLRDPNLDRARFGLAEQLRLNNRFTEALDEYAAYLARRPDDPSGYLGAGQSALENGNEAEAVRMLDKALALAPTDSVALAARATIELRRCRFESALRYVDLALKSDPFDRGNRYQRMLILNRLGKRSEAELERQAVERLQKEQDRFVQISRDLRTKPLDPELRAQAARWLMEHGHEDEAVEWANLVLRSDPSHPAANRLLADYYRQKGQRGLANLHEVRAASNSDHP